VTEDFTVRLGFSWDDLMSMYSDNQVVIYIASNLIFHERTKHIKVDCHFVHNAIAKLISSPFTPSSEEPITPRVCSYLCNNLNIIEIYAPS